VARATPVATSPAAASPPPSHCAVASVLQVLAFQDRYNATATPFDWTFTRTDLDRLLDRIAAHEAAAPIQSTGLATA
jgi:hypothetical protein